MIDAYREQIALQTKMGHTFSPGRAVIAMVSNWILATHTELSEALQIVPWKPWKTYAMSDYVTWDREHLLEELIDAQHFLFNSMIYAGFTPEEVQAAWNRKHAANHQRLQDGINKVLEQVAE